MTCSYERARAAAEAWAERQLWRARRGPSSDLPKETDIVPARPVFDNHAVDNTPDVHVGPRDRNTRSFGAREQSHR